jgi:hypothetical protein
MTREDLERLLIRMEVEYEEIAEGMWLLKSGSNSAPVVCHFSPPVVLLRLKVMDLPQTDGARLATLYRHMLELNATDMVHGSYGIEEDDVVLSDALDLETLDFEELRNSFESLVLAASSHLPKLAELVPATHEG